MDPLSALAPMTAEPDMSWLDDELADDENPAIGPLFDEEYVEAKKPSVTDIKDLIDELQADHGLRIGQAREMSEAYDGSRPGHFEEDEDDIENGVIETLAITTLRQMYDFRCGLIAMHEPYGKLLNRDAIDRDEAMAVEELVAYDFRCEERQFARAHGADLRLAEPAHLQRYGMLVGLDVLDPKDEYCGLSMSLIDPTTVFPVFGGSGGLVELYREYEDTAERIAGNYGGKPGSPEHERLSALLRKDAGRKKRAKTRTETRTVTECWNRDWVSVVVDDDKELLSRKHGYHRNPFTVVVGSFDLPAAASSGGNDDDDTVTTNHGEIAVNERSIDVARQMRPFDWRRLSSHRVAEAVAGRQLTMFKWALDPRKVLEKDPMMTKNKQTAIGRLMPGATTEVMLPNKLNLITPVVDPLTMAGLNMALAANAQSGVLGQLAAGSIPPQTSGSALNAMIEIGGAADAVLVRLIQLFKTLRAEFRLELRRDFGGQLGKSGDRGYISVPSSGGSARTPMHRVTPAIITRTGCQVEVELYNWRPDVTVAQYLATLRTPGPTGLPLISEETARRRLRAVADPDREAERIDDEMLMAQPPIAQQRTLSRLRRELKQALDEGDDESADSAMQAIQELQFLHEQAVASGQAAPPAGGAETGGGGGIPQGAGSPPPGPALPGTSLPAQGIGVGQQGGPPGGIAEPPAVTPTSPPMMSPIGGSEY